MKISTSSWHYRLLRWAWKQSWQAPESLCTYFWTLAATLAMMIVGAAVLLFVGVAAVIVIASAVMTVTVVAWNNPVIGGVIGVAALTSALVMALRSRTTKQRKPSMVVAYLTARKRKVCPTIEYTDGTEKEGERA